jgi:hypothetical protein
MPDENRVKEEAEEIRKRLLKQYRGSEHILGMSFENKQRLIRWLFEGKDTDGKPYGIFVNKPEQGHGAAVYYSMSGNFAGFLKDTDQPRWTGRRRRWTAPGEVYKTDSNAGFRRNRESAAARALSECDQPALPRAQETGTGAGQIWLRS